MNKHLALKVTGVAIPLVVALAGILYGDITPTIRSICEAALPTGTLIKEVDAGAPR
jgi:hypothetical protein